MTDTYQVVAECAWATVNTASGQSKALLYKGALVPADAPELQFLLDGGFVAKVGGDETGGVDASGRTLIEVHGGSARKNTARAATTTPGSEPGPTPAGPAATEAEAKAAAELAAKREAAAAKLPEDGSAPHANAGEAVWVEYLVRNGYDFDAIKDTDKPGLKSLAENLS